MVIFRPLQLSKRDFIRLTLAAVALLLQKISRPLTNVIFVFINSAISRISGLLSNVNIQAKSHFASVLLFGVVLFVPKFRPCSQGNQNHLLGDLFSFSACCDKPGNRQLVDPGISSCISFVVLFCAKFECSVK